MEAQLPFPISRGVNFRKGPRIRVASMVAGAQAAAVAVDRRVEEAPDGGKLTDFPPLVRLTMPAFLTTDAER
jgi:hypothetical protein